MVLNSSIKEEWVIETGRDCSCKRACVLQSSQCPGFVAEADRGDYVLWVGTSSWLFHHLKPFVFCTKIIHIFILGKFTQMTQTKCMSLICFVFFSNKELWNKRERRLENIGSVSTISDHHSNSVVLSAQFVQLISDPGHYLPEAGWDGTTNHRNSPENSQPLTEVRSLAVCVCVCVFYFIFLDFAFLILSSDSQNKSMMTFWKKSQLINKEWLHER